MFWTKNALRLQQMSLALQYHIDKTSYKRAELSDDSYSAQLCTHRQVKLFSLVGGVEACKMSSDAHRRLLFQSLPVLIFFIAIIDFHAYVAGTSQFVAHVYTCIQSNQIYWTTKGLKASYKLLKHTHKTYKMIKTTNVTYVQGEPKTDHF